MQSAKQRDKAESRLESYVNALGKLLAVGVILAPLAMMLFPELLNPAQPMNFTETKQPAKSGWNSRILR